MTHCTNIPRHHRNLDEAEVRTPKPMTSMRTHRHGLTLVEILVVIAIVAILFSFIVGMVIQLVNNKRTIEAQSRAFLVGPQILRLIQRDLEGVYIHQLTADLTEGDPEAEPDPDDKRRNYFNGKDNGEFDPDPLTPAECEDSIHFISTVDSTLRIGNKQSDLCEVGYYLNETEGDDAIPGLFTMYRREDFHVDKQPTEGGKAVKLYDRVRALSFRYYKWPENTEERDSFYEGSMDPVESWDNTEEGGLPMAVEISVWIDMTADLEQRGEIDEEAFRRYQTLVMLPRFPLDEELNPEEGAGTARWMPKPFEAWISRR